MFAAAPGCPFPLRTTSGTSFGLGADFVFFRLPGSTWSVALSGASTSGCANSAIGGLDVRGRRRELVRPGQPADLDLEEVAGGHLVREARVLVERARRDSLTTGLPDLHVLRHRVDDLEDVPRVLELVPHDLLHRLHELLLAAEPEEVGVGVPVAHEVERLPALQALVAGPEVDRGVVAALEVDVAAVDVEPDAAELVDALPEAVEVDADQEVDRETRQLANRLERPLGAAVRVRGVDSVRGGATVRALDLDDEVAGKGEHRDRVVRRIGAQEHERVRAGRSGSVLGTVVVADHERDTGPLGSRHLEHLCSRLEATDRRRPLEALELPQVGAAGDSGGRRQADGYEHEQDRPERSQEAALALGPAVPRDRAQRPGRQDGLPVAVDDRYPADSSLERCSHPKKRERLSALAKSMLADYAATSTGYLSAPAVSNLVTQCYLVAPAWARFRDSSASRVPSTMFRSFS